MNFHGFYFITDSSLTKQGIVKDVADAIEGGATIVQYREKSKDTQSMVEEAIKVKEECKGKAILLIDDRIDVALAADADGVHLGQKDMAYQAARRLLGEKIIGLSTHSLNEAKEAESIGADYIAVGPIFETNTKKDAGPPVGINLIKEVSENLSIPIVAIGGIKLDNAKDIIDAGATTFCAISATVGNNVEESVKEFNKIISNS